MFLCRLVGLLSAQPTNVEAAFLLGVTYFKQKSFQKAEKVLQRILQVNPSHTDALYQLGMCNILGHFTFYRLHCAQRGNYLINFPLPTTCTGNAILIGWIVHHYSPILNHQPSYHICYLFSIAACLYSDTFETCMHQNVLLLLTRRRNGKVQVYSSSFLHETGDWWWWMHTVFACCFFKVYCHGNLDQYLVDSCILIKAMQLSLVKCLANRIHYVAMVIVCFTKGGL